jgi:hypothetical protein
VEAAGFNAVRVTTVTKQLRFPSMLDYERFQLVATPMAILLKGIDGAEREQMIASIAADAAARLDGEMSKDGRLAFPLESQVVIAEAPL